MLMAASRGLPGVLVMVGSNSGRDLTQSIGLLCVKKKVLVIQSGHLHVVECLANKMYKNTARYGCNTGIKKRKKTQFRKQPLRDVWLRPL